MIRYLIAKGRKTLIIVPNISLVEQLFSDFHNDYGWTNAMNHVCLNYGGKNIDLQKRGFCLLLGRVSIKIRNRFLENLML